MDEDIILYEESFEAIMERLLSNVPESLDTREGSIIYNALASAAWEIQLLYEELNSVLDEAFADTASLDYLIRRAAERGIIHKEATRAIVKAQISPGNIDVTGGRFTELETGLSYVATKKIEDGIYELECETAGEEGNLTSGQLVTDETFDDDVNLESAQIIGIVNTASDEEDVEAFRQRYFDSIENQSFGGNIADYKSKMLENEKVGAVKVYPAWNGGGTVKLVVLNNSYSAAESSVVNELQTIIDPEQNKGAGKGLAPIGHIVTVESAEAVPINIAAEITYANGNTEETAMSAMKAAVEEYFLSVRKEWGGDDCDTGSIIRISYIENKLLNCGVVLDVQVTSINGSDKNIELASNQVPVVGDITNGISGT